MTERVDNGVGDYGMAGTTEQRIVRGWLGTDPMQSEGEVRQALEAMVSGGDISVAEIDALMPGVVREARDAGLLVTP